MFTNIRLRLTLSHLAVIIIAMGVSGFLLLSLLEQYFVQAIEDSLVAQARITAQALIPGAGIEGPPINEDQATAYNSLQQQRVGKITLQTENVVPPTGDLAVDLNNLADASVELGTLLDTHIRILDAQGQVMVDSQVADQGESMLADNLVTQALTGNYASRKNPGSLRQEPSIDLALPIMVEEKLVGVVYLSQSLSDVTTVLNDLRLLWLLATLVALAFSGLVGLFLSRAIANPVRQLTAAANAVAEGRLDQQVPTKSKDELGQLSRTFNEMTHRLQAARQMQIDMVANVSHELRTPLTAIKGLLETLRGGAMDDPDVRDSFLEMAEEQTNRLIRMVKDLLLLSRVDSDTLKLQKKFINLAQLAQDTVDCLWVQAETKTLEITVNASPNCPQVQVDPDRIEQVLLNLLDNAIKYSKPNGKIEINLSCSDEGKFLVEVKDEGIGIAPDDLQRIGERFYRTDRARSRTEGGSGLGLAIARSLVEAHGGQLWLESKEGMGTAVKFTLPN